MRRLTPDREAAYRHTCQTEGVVSAVIPMDLFEEIDALRDQMEALKAFNADMSDELNRYKIRIHKV